ncbi:uncharacterized protein LOC129944653 [Eupeodes corollae]|uniref:uncharacterized protein LOC129944653 n=1 Tax=Eupeodes corollae TaxID=290404 RepID=UPI0024901043|nr:uncharacterized protein LOC129944653 [Eupeodes corollae]
MTVVIGVLTFLILVAGNFASDIILRNLIEQIYNKGGTPTVYFVQTDQDFVVEFARNHSDIPLVIITSQDIGNTSYNSSNAILAVETSNLPDQFDSLLQRVIRTLQIRRFVIISAKNLEDLKKFCFYFVKNNFSRIFGIVGNTSYVYLNYESEPIQELDQDKPLPVAWKNFNGFSLRATIQKDIPRVFWYRGQNGRNQIGGCFGRLMLNFLQYHNATYHEVFPNLTSQFRMPLVINALKNDEIDITFNVWGPTVGLVSSYPVRYQSYTIMVPLNGYLDPNEYFLRPFTLGVWLLIGFTMSYIIVMDILTNALCHAIVNVWNSFSRTFLIILNSSYTGPCADYRFHVQIMLLAFVLGNVYLIHFTSFLTVFIKIKQYNTKLDLVENKVPVMIPTFEWKVVEGPGLTAIGFDKIIYTVDYPVYYETAYSMQNTKYAYAIGADRAKFLIGLQTFFAKPLFHTTRDELFTSHLGYLLTPYSPLQEILDEYVHRISELGLMAKWEGDAVSQALRAGFKITVNRQAGVPKTHSPLTVNHLQFAWNCLLSGLTISFVVFLFEKYGHNLKSYFRKNKEKM